MKKAKILSSAIGNKLAVCWNTCSQVGVTLVASSILVTLVSGNKSIAANDLSLENQSGDANSTNVEKELEEAVNLETGVVTNEDAQEFLKQKLKEARQDRITRIRRAIERNKLNSSQTAKQSSLAIENTVTEDILTSTETNQNSQYHNNNSNHLEARKTLISRLKESTQRQNNPKIEALEQDISLTLPEPSAVDISEQEDKNLIEPSSLNPTNDKKVIGQNLPQSTAQNNTTADAEELRRELLIEPIIVFTDVPSASPGSTAGTPSAFGASWGQAFIGGGLSIPFDRDRVDSSFSAGFGFGDAKKSVGLEVSANVTSVSPDDFADSGSVGFKLHRHLPGQMAVAVGWSNAIKWGDVNTAKDTFYGVVTRAFPLQPNNRNNTLPLTVSVGLGSGSFRSKGAIDRNENNVNVFGSLGLRVLPEVSFVSSWTGNRLNMGISLTPIQKTPLVVNVIFTDVTSNLRTGAGFSLSAGYSFRF